MNTTQTNAERPRGSEKKAKTRPSPWCSGKAPWERGPGADISRVHVSRDTEAGNRKGRPGYQVSVRSEAWGGERAEAARFLCRELET